MDTIIVTGGAGFVGSNLANALAAGGHSVVALDNLLLGNPANLTTAVKFIKGDVRNPADLEKAKAALSNKIDYIVHLAAASSSPMFVDDLIDSYDNNVIGFLRVLEFARANNVKKVLYASTSSIYGNNPTPLTEDQEVRPPNFYSVTKHAMEETAHVYSPMHNMELIGFRFMSVYGLHEEHKAKFANLVSQFIWKIGKNEQPVLYGDGTQERDFTNVRDIVQAITLAMATDKKFGSTIFNIGIADSVNLIDLVALINKGFHKDIKPKFIENPVKSGYVKSQLASIDKISTELGYKPSVTLEQGIAEIIAHLKDIPDVKD